LIYERRFGVYDFSEILKGNRDVWEVNEKCKIENVKGKTDVFKTTSIFILSNAINLPKAKTLKGKTDVFKSTNRKLLKGKRDVLCNQHMQFNFASVVSLTCTAYNSIQHFLKENVSISF